MLYAGDVKPAPLYAGRPSTTTRWHIRAFPSSLILLHLHPRQPHHPSRGKEESYMTLPLSGPSTRLQMRGPQ